MAKDRVLVPVSLSALLVDMGQVGPEGSTIHIEERGGKSCAYCNRPIGGTQVMCRGKYYHALEDENGNFRQSGRSCWEKSDNGLRTLLYEEST